MRKIYFSLPVIFSCFFTISAFAQIPASHIIQVTEAKTSTTAEIMQLRRTTPKKPRPEMEEREYPDRSLLPQNPLAPAVSGYPPVDTTAALQNANRNPALNFQTPSTSFTSVTLAEAGAFPPDVMGAIGPAQFITFVNGRIKSHNKTTGAAGRVVKVIGANGRELAAKRIVVYR